MTRHIVWSVCTVAAIRSRVQVVPLVAGCASTLPFAGHELSFFVPLAKTDASSALRLHAGVVKTQLFSALFLVL